MCTVTIVSSAGEDRTNRSFRLACNRDESRSRPPADPPEIRTIPGGKRTVPGGRRALMPVDPVGGGTWIAANDAGVAFTLLNVYETAGASGKAPGARSRGLIIPELLPCADLPEAIAALAAIDGSDFSPFRIVMTDGVGVADARWVNVPGGAHDGAPDGARWEIAVEAFEGRGMIFTSSGLGDAVVRGPRTGLFRSVMRRAKSAVEAQDAFHRHSWPDRPEISVCMRRDDARTVSCTVVESDARAVRMIYCPEAPDSGAERTQLALPRS